MTVHTKITIHKRPYSIEPTWYRKVLRPIPGTAPKLFGSCTPPKKISIGFSFFYFQIKIFCHFQGNFTIWPRVLVANDTFQHDLRTINRVEKRNFLGKFPHLDPGPGGKFILNHKDFSSCTPTRTRSSSRIIWDLYRGQAAKLNGSVGEKPVWLGEPQPFLVQSMNSPAKVGVGSIIAQPKGGKNWPSQKVSQP